MGTTLGEAIQEITQAVLAIIVVGGSVGLVLVLVLRGQDANAVPDWLTLALGAVTGFYFGARASSAVVNTMTNGPLHLIASMQQRAPRRSTDPEPVGPEEQ